MMPLYVLLVPLESKFFVNPVSFVHDQFILSDGILELCANHLLDIRNLLGKDLILLYGIMLLKNNAMMMMMM